MDQVSPLPNVMLEGEFKIGGRKITAAAIRASAERLLPVVLGISAKLGQTERTGGVVQARLAEECRILAFFRVGDRPGESMVRYAAAANEKACRLWVNIPKGHVLASESANEDEKKWPGGAVSGRKKHLRRKGLIITSSGWKATLDEAYSIGILVDLGLMSWGRAMRLAGKRDNSEAIDFMVKIA